MLPYTSRKGCKYFLRKAVTKTGKTRYIFTRAPSKDAIREVPPGFRIVESVNGVVSLAKAGAPPIDEEEVQAVQTALRRIPRLARYAVEARRKDVIVFEPIGGPDADTVKMSGFGGAAAGRYLERHVQYVPVLRFTPIDPAKREFLAARMCYRSWVDGWLCLNDTGTIRELCRRYLPHLDRESFFELF